MVPSTTAVSESMKNSSSQRASCAPRFRAAAGPALAGWRTKRTSPYCAFSASYASKRWTATLGARWVDAFRWSTGVYQGEVPAYTTTDISASYKISELARVGANVANFRDDVHRQTFGGDLLTRRALLFVVFTF